VRKKVRLSDFEIKTIKETAREVFGGGAKVYIFGSRTDTKRKGGDIDIFIKTEREVTLDQKLTFLARLELKGIERKIDLLVLSPDTEVKDIHKEALRTGIEI